MADEILINDIIDVNGITGDIDKVLAQINRIDKAIQDVNKNPLNLGQVGGLRDLRQAADQLNKSLKELNANIAGLSRNDSAIVFQQTAKAQKDNANATNDNISAYQKLKNEVKEAELNAKNLAAEFGKDSKEAIEAAQAYDVLRQKLELVNSVTRKPQQQQPEVPFTSNVTEVNNENLQTIQATGDAVNDLERSEAKAANAATTLGSAQQKANETFDESIKTVPEIVGELDAYTGSITQNVKAQFENTAALAKNRAEQKEILATITGQTELTDQQAAKLAQLKKEEISLIETNKNLTLTIKNQVKEFISEEGSIDNLRARLALLQKQYESLTVAEKSSDFGVSLKGQIDTLDPALKKAEEEIGKTGRQVGSYSSAITGALSGAFSWLRQIAYILPGVGIAGILSAAIDPAVALVKSMFELDEGIRRDTSSLGELKENLARVDDEIKRTNSDLEIYFKYLDRLKDAPKINIEVSNINVDPITKLKNELNGLQLEAGIAQQKYLEAEKEFETTTLSAGDLQNKFLNNASKDAVKAYFNGTIESIKDGLSETDKVLYDGFVKANEAYTKSSENFANIFTLRESAIQRVNEKVKEIAKESDDEQRQIARDNSVAIQEIIKAKNGAILSSEKSSLNDRISAIKSNYAAEQAIIIANRQFVLSDPTKSAAERNAAIKQANADLAKAEIAFQQATFKTKEDYRRKDIEAEKQAFVQKKQLQVEQLKQLSQDTEFPEQDRLRFQQAAFEAQKAIIDKEHQALIDSKEFVDLTDKEKLAIETDYQTKLLEATRQNSESITQIIRAEIEKQQRLRQEDIDAIDRLYKSLNVDVTDQYTKDVIALNDSLKDKLISYEQYLKDRKKLDNTYRQGTLENSIGDIETKLQSKPFTEAESQVQSAEFALAFFQSKLRKAKTDDERESAGRSISLARIDLDNARKNLDAKKDLEKQLDEYKKQLSDSNINYDLEKEKEKYAKIAGFLQQATELANQIGSLGAALIQRRINLIEEESKALDDRYQKEQDLIKQSYTSQIDQQQKLAEAEARYNAQKHQLEERERQEKIRQAKFEKEANIASIVLTTASNVVKAFPNPVLMAIAGVIGAAQLAVAAATPIPRFFKGKNVTATDNYEGWAVVDDGPDGKGNAPETIIREDGTIEKGGNKPRVTYLKSKDIVLPTAKALAFNATMSATKPNEYTVTNTFDSTEIVSELKQNNRLLRAIKNKPVIKMYNRSPLDDWMGGKIDTGNLFK